jgi:hypothetical protein
MSFSGQSGVIAVGPQTGKGVVATTYYQFAATDIDFDAISPGGVLPPEIAGVLTPRGAYKMGVFAAGGFSFIPRLDGDLGWLLLGLFGEVETVAAFSNAVMDWQTLVDSDDLYDSTTGNWFTDPDSARILSVFTDDSDADSDFNIVVSGTGPQGEAVSDTLEGSAGDPLLGGSGVVPFLTVTSVTVGSLGSLAAGAKFALGWTATDAADQLVVPFTSNDVIDSDGWADSDITNPPVAAQIQATYGAIAAGGDVGDLGASAQLTYLVTGTDATGAIISETLTLDSDTQQDVGALTFSTITSIGGDSDMDSDHYVAFGYVTAEAYEHFFTYGATQETIDWATIRKVVPGDTYLYTQALDCKLAMMRFIIPQAGPVAARIDAVGRVPTFPDGSAWAYDAMDDPDAFPVANAPGYFRFTQDAAVNELGVTGMVFEIVNLLTTPQEEMTVGSNYPDDFGVRGRAVTARFVYRWKNPELCLQIMTGAIDGTAWTAQVFTTDLEAAVTTPGVMGDDQESPYQIKFVAPKVEFRQNGPVRLVGNQTIAIEYIGSVLTPEGSGSPAWSGDGEYFAAALRNEVSAYVWPS